MYKLTIFVGLLVALGASVALTGCSICCSPFDYDYPTFGGKHTRATRNFGRVGSVFSDPFLSTGGPGADSNLTPHEGPPPLRPTEADEDLEDDLDLDADLDSDPDKDLDLDTDLDLENIEPESVDPDILDADQFPKNPTLPRPDDANSSSASNYWKPRPLRRR